MLSATQMFQAPNMVTMSIAATRMYRSLVNFGSSVIAYDSNDHQESKPTVSTRVHSRPIPLNPVEFARCVEIDQCATYDLPRSDVVESKLPTQTQLGESNDSLV